MFRNVGTGFGSVVGIVEADTHELADPADTGADPHIRRHRRQAGRVNRPDPVQTGRIERRARYVVDMGGQVADGAVRVENARLFPADVTVAKKFHLRSPKSLMLDD